MRLALWVVLAARLYAQALRAPELPVSIPAPAALAGLSAAPEPVFGPSEFEGLEGRGLLYAIRASVSRTFQPSEYDRARNYLLSVADVQTRGGVAGLVDAYSGRFHAGRWFDGSLTRPDGMAGEELNVEHLWPQQYYEGRLPMRSDLHHLITVSPNINGKRSSLPFGEGPGTFEPPDESKGIVARGLFYFYSHFFESKILLRKAAYKFWNPQIETLLRWNRENPPTEREKRANELKEAYQGNRNPFVDDPALADRVGKEGFEVPVPRPIHARRLRDASRKRR